MEFKITIVFNPETKDCQVSGPLKNKELCDLGMQLAKEVMEQNRRRSIISMPASEPIKVNLPNIKALLQNGR